VGFGLATNQPVNPANAVRKITVYNRLYLFMFNPP
jgi:hypothetical protein